MSLEMAVLAATGGPQTAEKNSSDSIARCVTAVGAGSISVLGERPNTRR